MPFWDVVLGIPGRPTVPRLMPGLLGIAVYLAGARLLFSGRYQWLNIIWSILFTAAIPILLLNLIDDPLHQLYACTASGCSGGFLAAPQLSPAMLRDWPAHMPEMRGKWPHLAISNAPGWPLVYRATATGLAAFPALADRLANELRPLQCLNPDLIRLSPAQMASAWIGIATPLWGALTVLPLYWLGQRPGRRAHRRARPSSGGPWCRPCPSSPAGRPRSTPCW